MTGSSLMNALILPPQAVMTTTSPRSSDTIFYNVYPRCAKLLVAFQQTTISAVSAVGALRASNMELPSSVGAGSYPFVTFPATCEKVKIPSEWFGTNAPTNNWASTNGGVIYPTVFVFDNRATFPHNFTAPANYPSGGRNYYLQLIGAVLDFRAQTTVPTFISTDDFYNCIPPTARIVVPDALYADWIADADWSAVANQIVKASDYQAS